MTNFEPKILALCCHYCAYAAADLAGSMRIQYPPNVRVLRLPCTGKVDSTYLLKAFERGVRHGEAHAATDRALGMEMPGGPAGGGRWPGLEPVGQQHVMLPFLGQVHGRDPA